MATKEETADSSGIIGIHAYPDPDPGQTLKPQTQKVEYFYKKYT
jgi:hypothetical protein